MARGLGLPLEAPKEATRGWDIASLQMGLHGVSPSHAALFGLFCRCCHCCVLIFLVSGGQRDDFGLGTFLTDPNSCNLPPGKGVEL